jgi:hypothetical protein
MISDSSLVKINIDIVALGSSHISFCIAAFQEIDNTICSYRGETSDVQHEFKKIISLCRGETITIESKNRKFYGALGEEFENEELLPFHVLVHVKTLMETIF